TADLIVIDEAARVPDALYYAVRPMLATTGGTLVCLTSAFAKSGVFYSEWTGTEPGGSRVRGAATVCPRISPEVLAEERRSLGERWFTMEYLCEFGDDIAAVFRAEDIRAAFTRDVLPLFGPRVGTVPALTTGSADPSSTPLFGRSR